MKSVSAVTFVLSTFVSLALADKNVYLRSLQNEIGTFHHTGDSFLDISISAAYDGIDEQCVSSMNEVVEKIEVINTNALEKLDEFSDGNEIMALQSNAVDAPTIESTCQEMCVNDGRRLQENNFMAIFNILRSMGITNLSDVMGIVKIMNNIGLTPSDLVQFTKVMNDMGIDLQTVMGLVTGVLKMNEEGTLGILGMVQLVNDSGIFDGLRSAIIMAHGMGIAVVPEDLYVSMTTTDEELLATMAENDIKEMASGSCIERAVFVGIESVGSLVESFQGKFCPKFCSESP